MVLRNPQPSDFALAEIYSATYFLGSSDPARIDETARLKQDTAKLYLDEICSVLGGMGESPRGTRLLEIGCGMGDLLSEAQALGFDVRGVEFSASAAAAANQRLGDEIVIPGTIENAIAENRIYDVCVLADVLEHTRDPAAFLDKVYQVLRPGGIVFLSLPTLDSWSARVMKSNWMEFKAEHLFYFNRETIGNLAFKAGFQHVRIKPNWKILTFDYIHAHFTRFPVPVLTPLMQLLRRVLPRAVAHWPVKIVASGMNVTATRAKEPPPSRRMHKLSVIVPVYNERRTFREVIERLLALALEDIELEVIIVESNSTDGTRQEVESIQRESGVKVIFQESPRGKGHAVREGLAHATGDFILIQDADLEYDLNDYPLLLDPLRRYRKAFVLGSRHSDQRSWKIRHFSDQLLISTLMNVGHVFFGTIFNLLYGQKLSDPFTMFKVFRRDCIHDIAFECNGFDFDCELVAKLVRRGFTPVEVAVNYASRSFREGKKVSFFRDPPTYLRAFLKYRVQRLDR
jgi:2-polyprenyl-3-methyl-5-hydroxy-6-metoxy-1,4-benzoquinol methylase